MKGSNLILASSKLRRLVIRRPRRGIAGGGPRFARFGREDADHLAEVCCEDEDYQPGRVFVSHASFNVWGRTLGQDPLSQAYRLMDWRSFFPLSLPRRLPPGAS